MAVLKLSQITAAGSAPASTDQVVGVTGGTTDNLFTLTQIGQSALNSIATTQGDILYNNGSNWVALAPGTSGNFLQTHGAAANPTWAAVSGSGLVVGGSAISGGVTGGVLWDNGGTLEESSNFVWQNTGQHLLIANGTIDTKNGAGIIITSPTPGGGSANVQIGTVSVPSGVSDNVIISDANGVWSFANDYSNKNVFVGSQGGNYGTLTGTGNTTVGYTAGQVLTSATGNVLIGNAAGSHLTSGSNNVALGTNALLHATTDPSNFALGQAALQALNTSSGNNVAIGIQAGSNLTTGNTNILIGPQAGDNLLTGGFNTAIGPNSAGSNWVGSETSNTFIGGYRGVAGNNNQIVISDGVANLGFVQDFTNSNLFLGGSSGNYGTVSGTQNIIVGINSGSALTTGNQNVVVGGDALQAVTTGTNNFALGYQTLRHATGSNNVGIGTNVLDTAGFTGGSNVAIGTAACQSFNGAESNNTAIGYQAGNGGTGNGYCTYIGYFAGYGKLSDSSSTYIGNQAGINITGGTNNTLLGGYQGPATSVSNQIVISDGAGNLGFVYDITNDNIFQGEVAGNYGTATGTKNIAIGHSALGALTTGSHIVAVGYQALKNLTTSASNDAVVIGYQAGMSFTSDLSSSIGIGTQVYFGATNISLTTAIGTQTMLNASGVSSTVVIGDESGQSMTGSNNVGIGGQCLENCASNSNVAIGQGAMGSSAGITGTGQNVAIGVNALKSVTSGAQNMCFGFSAGALLTTGGTNVAIGSNALSKATTNGANVAIGQASLQNCNAAGNTINIAIGAQTLHNLTTGDSNTVIGSLAGGNLTSSERANTIIGNHAGNTGGSNQIIISDGDGNDQIDWGATNSGKWTVASAFVFKNYTVSTLPAGVTGSTAYITDGDAGLTWGATAVNSGSGATKYLVWYNGSNWTITGK